MRFSLLHTLRGVRFEVRNDIWTQTLWISLYNQFGNQHLSNCLAISIFKTLLEIFWQYINPYKLHLFCIKICSFVCFLLYIIVIYRFSCIYYLVSLSIYYYLILSLYYFINTSFFCLTIITTKLLLMFLCVFVCIGLIK